MKSNARLMLDSLRLPARSRRNAPFCPFALIAARTVRMEGLEARQLLNGGAVQIDDGGIYGESAGPEAQVFNRWTTTASGSTGAIGNPATLTWGFVADGLNIPTAGTIAGELASASNLQARLNALYGSSAVWQPLFASVFDRWSSLSGLTYVFTGFADDNAAFPQGGVSNGAAGLLGVRPDVRIAGHTTDGTFNNLAYNYFPNSGDMVVDTSDFNPAGYFTGTANTSRRLRNVVAHEHGHGLGFNHVDPINQTKLMEATASTNPPFDGPQFDDIYAAQVNYGDPFEKGGRNETPATASNLGTLANGSNAVSAWVNANNPTNARSIANTSDVDYLKFTITGSKNLAINVSAFGPTYTQGAQGGATAAFNAAAQGDLSITVFDVNGTTVLSSSNLSGLGGSESAALSNLPAGTYFLRVGIASGATQAYDVSINVTDAAVAAPSTPDLDVFSDTGVFSADNVTNDTTPTFIGTAVIGSTVSLFSGASLLGTGITNAAGNWSITVATPLPGGSPSFFAVAQVGATSSVASGSLSVTIDTTAPFISAATFSRSPVQTLDFGFSENVFGTVGGLSLQNMTTLAAVPTNLGPTGPAAIRFFPAPANSLTDGHYLGSLLAGSLTDLAGNAPLIGLPSIVFDFLRADFNNDKTVSFDDLLTIAQNYNHPGLTNAQGDANYDGSIDFSDLLIVAQTYGNSLAVLGGQRSELTPSTQRSDRLGRKRGNGSDEIMGTPNAVL